MHISFFKSRIIKFKLGDVREGNWRSIHKRTKRYKKGALEHLKKCWDTLDHADALKFCHLQYSTVAMQDPERARGLILPKSVIKYSNQRENQRAIEKAHNFVKVITSLKEHGYSPDKFPQGRLKVMGNYMLTDGNHRFESLLAKYGEDYEVEGIRVHVVWFTILKFLQWVAMIVMVFLFGLLVLGKCVSIAVFEFPFSILRNIYGMVVGKFRK